MKAERSAKESPRNHKYDYENASKHNNSKQGKEDQQNTRTNRNVVAPTTQWMLRRIVNRATDMRILHPLNVICQPFMNAIIQSHRSINHVV